MEIKHKLALKIGFKRLPETFVGTLFGLLLGLGIFVLQLAAFAPQLLLFGYWINEGNAIVQNPWIWGCAGFFGLSSVVAISCLMKSSYSIGDMPNLFYNPENFSGDFHKNYWVEMMYHVAFNGAFLSLLAWWVGAMVCAIPFFLFRKGIEAKENWDGLCDEVLEDHTQELSEMEKKRLQSTLTQSSSRSSSKRL